jgi:hypothetical protein
LSLEAVALKALEKTLTTAASQVAKRVWSGRLSPAAKRARVAQDVLKVLTSYRFGDRLQLSVVLPALPHGISLAKVKTHLGGATYQGLVHELVAARLLDMPELTVLKVRENVQLATRFEFPDADSDKAFDFGGVLFDELDRVVQELVAELNTAQQPGLAEVRQGAALTLLDAGADSINRHNAHLKQSSSLAGLAAVAEWERTYRGQVRTAHGFITPPDFERKLKVPIDSLFVSPQITRTVVDQVKATDAWGLYERIDRTVLLGDPGGGKSTASNLFAWRAAAEVSGPVPFLVVLRTYADQKESIREHIEASLSTYYQCPAPPDAVEGLLLSGKALIIFDGLDELIDTSRRRGVTDRVELFCAKYPLVRVLVTSRRVGYEQAAMDQEVFEVHQLAQFSGEDVKSYVRNWFQHVDDSSDEVAEAKAKSFVTESSAVPDLRRNPLMLALMCIIYRGQNWIPRNRPDMYEHCARLLFEKWDSSRHIYVELKASAHVDGAVKRLAYWMFTEPGPGQGVTETELVREATVFLEPVFNTRAEAEAAAREFIEFCRGRGWVLTDVGSTADGEALFAFTHRTFMEYFAAYELTRSHDGPEKLAKALISHIAAQEWEVVAQLAVQISNKHFRDGAARLLSALINDKRYRNAVSRRNLTSFAMRCLGFTHVPLPVAKQLANAYIEAMLRLGVEGPGITGELLSTVPDLQQTVEGEIIAVLTDAITTAQLPRKHVAIEVALELVRLTNSDNNGLIQRTSDTARWRRHREALLTGLKREILTLDDDATWFVAWRLDLISLEELFNGRLEANGYPLDILFRNTNYRYVRQGGRGDWGTFIPMRLLQAGADQEADFPLKTDELDWLGHFINSLGNPPWASQAADASHIFGSSFNGDFLADKLMDDQGWTAFRLMLTGIEWTRSPVEAPLDGDCRTYDQVFSLLWFRRENGQELPQWLAEVLDNLHPDRRELVWAWLDREVNFVADSDVNPRYWSGRGRGGLRG